MSGGNAVSSCCYGDATFYETRDHEKYLEWYAEFDTIRPLLQKHLQFSDSILVLGPGTSSLHEDLYASGYRGITCIDFCSKVLQQWRQRSADAGHTGINYQLADIVQGLPFEHYPYNAIIDKGTLDCVLCRETGEEDGKQALTVVSNNLKNPGTLVMLSHSPPAVRLPLLKSVQWESIQVESNRGDEAVWNEIAITETIARQELVKVIAPPELNKLAAGEAVVMVREYSAAVQVPDDSVYVYVCKKPYYTMLPSDLGLFPSSGGRSCE